MKKNLWSKSWLTLLIMLLCFSWSWGQGTETFTNIPASSGSYDNRSWTGDNGFVWNATNARTDQTINGKAIATNGNGTVTSPTVAGGIGTLSFNYSRAFTGTGARSIQVFVNGSQIGSTITVNPNSNNIATYVSPALNILGDVQIQLVTAGAQIKIDDVSWTGYIASTTAPTVTGASLTATVGTPFTYQVQATENPTSYAVSAGALPAGLTLGNAGVISGTPTAAGNFSAQITATNTAGTSAPASFSFHVAQGTQTITGFNDTSVNFANTQQVTLPATSDQGVPLTYTSSDPSVATVSGNVLTFSQSGTVTVTAANSGDANYGALNISKTFTADNFCFQEDFSSITTGNSTTTGGSSTAWTGNTNFPTVNTAYQAGGAVRIGSGSATGLITSLPLSNIGGDVTVSFDVKGWTNVEGDILVSFGTAQQTVTYTAKMGNAFETKSVTFTNLPVGSALSIATSAGRAFIDNVSVSCGTATVWNGTAWSNGVPNNTVIAGINGNYSGAGFEAAQLTVNQNYTLNITETVSVLGNVINNGSVIVADGGNFIQAAGSAYTAGTGALFTVNKTSSTPDNLYVFWSSPVIGQDMANMYPGVTLPGSSVKTYVTATDGYADASPSVAEPGKGYAVRKPAGSSAVSFTGAPNNGTVNLALNNTVNANGNAYNLIGNPYPSALNLATFYSANNTSVGSSFYFYNVSSADRWGTYNAATSTWARANAGTTTNSIEPAQGFIVTAVGTSVSFDNTMRNNAADAVFVNKNASAAEGKFWLEMTTPSGAAVGNAVTYGYGGADSFDAADSKIFAAGDNALYSVLANSKLAIQGKAPFHIDDVVLLGNRQLADGQHTISLSAAAGVFANGQPVYLHDKYLGTYTDLQAGSYTFQATAGEQLNRFEIVYKQAAMGVTEVKSEDISVFAQGAVHIIESPEKIEKVWVYDSAGRLHKELAPSANRAAVELTAKGMYILRIKVSGKELTKKILK